MVFLCRRKTRILLNGIQSYSRSITGMYLETYADQWIIKPGHVVTPEDLFDSPLTRYIFMEKSNKLRERICDRIGRSVYNIDDLFTGSCFFIKPKIDTTVKKRAHLYGILRNIITGNQERLLGRLIPPL